MLEFYLDTADVGQVSRLQACLPVNGVTTNPSILAKANIGLNELLSVLSQILGAEARFFAQVVSSSADEMIEEAVRLCDLPFDLVVKVPATEIGFSAIKTMKALNIKVLATAIYSAQQGFLAALCGADYLAPYVNRIDTMGGSGIQVVADLQCLIEQHCLPCKLVPASFKSTQQVMAVLKLGVGAITIPVDVVAQMLMNPLVDGAVEQFDRDWSEAFGNALSFQS